MTDKEIVILIDRAREDGRAAGFRAGQERMRERAKECAHLAWVHDGDDTGWSQCAEHLEAAIAALPLEDE